MGKLFRGKNGYTDEDFENDEMLEEELEDEIDEDEIGNSEDTNDVMSDSEAEIDSENGGESEGEEDDDDDSEDEEEWDEDERRAYRRRRRVRNQIISYAIVLVLLAMVVVCGVFVGRNIAGTIKEKKLAEEQERMQEELQAQQEAEAAHDIVIEAPTVPIEVEPEPEVDRIGELVAPYIAEMPIEDKVAGLFIITPEALTGVTTATQAGTGTQDALNEYAVGGLIYFDKNIVSEEQIKTMLSNTAAQSRYPIFLAVDEEGGSVSRVAGSSIDVIKVGDMAAIGDSGDVTQAYEAGLTIGTYLNDLGFNTDFAPVADVSGGGSSALGDRVFGSDAQLVGDMVSNVVEGIEENDVSSCLKHFPGIGYLEGDTHDGRVETTKTLDEMRNSDFIPFKAGIEAGADFVMVSHVTVADVDTVPSTLSKTIMTDVLRNELGFQGVIITDALNMGAITEYYTTEEAAVQAIIAGADMLLMPDDFQTAYNAVLAAVQDGTISEERINESLERIYRVKCEWMLD